MDIKNAVIWIVLICIILGVGENYIDEFLYWIYEAKTSLARITRHLTVFGIFMLVGSFFFDLFGVETKKDEKKD